MIVKVPEHQHGHVFDANGDELKFCTWADTETGEAVHIVAEDSYPRFTPTVNDASELVVRTEWRQHAAPLRYVQSTTPEVE
jgi:hypothetical protein